MKFKNKIEQQDTKEIIESSLINWDFFRNKTVMITGATGLIGSQLVKAFLYANANKETNVNVVALVRNPQKVKDIFGNTKKDKIKFIYQDISKELKFNKKADFIIHTANSTSSASFVEEPVETISSIVQGTKNILNFAIKSKAKSVVYLSSMEVYGEIPLTREEPLGENDLGYIDILEPRSSYQEGKRTAECLCSAYAHEYNVPVKIARLAQTFGAGVDYNDNRVFAQFARNIVEKQDIVLKTKGETIRSYCYITDAVVAILLMLEKGTNGESYNVANSETTCSIKEMAEMLCNKYPSSNLAIQLEENKQYLGTLKYHLSSEKIQNKTGWVANVSLEKAYRRLVDSFYYQKNNINLSLYTKNEKKEKVGYSFLEHIFSVKNTFEHKVIRILGVDIKINRQILYKKYFKIPIEENKIVFSNFNGNGYGCNPKYIAEEIIKRKLPYKLVWLAKTNVEKSQFPSIIKVVDFNSKQALKELATAKIWIDNQRKIVHIKKGLRKREGQIYLQTWHGSLGIKKLDADVANFNTPDKITWVENAKYDSSMVDNLLTNSNFEENILTKSLWINTSSQVGHPRNDILFSSPKTLLEIKNKVFKNLGIEQSKKVFMYAPSFRDDYRLDCFMLDTQALKQALEERFGGDWCILIRMHPRLASVSNIVFEYNESIINASYYPDIQELLSASDVVMTDYSSCIFDFMLSRKPAFIFATDIEDFNTERGFYYPLETTPFPVAVNNFDLIAKIKNFDKEKYKVEVENFLKEKGCMEDGQASKRVVDVIEQIIKTNFKGKA